MKSAVTTNAIDRNRERFRRALANGAMMPATQSGASKRFTDENLTDGKLERRTGKVARVIVGNQLEEGEAVDSLPENVGQRDRGPQKAADPKIARAKGRARSRECESEREPNSPNRDAITRLKRDAGDDSGPPEGSCLAERDRTHQKVRDGSEGDRLERRR